MNIKNKKISIIGAARSGVAAAKLALRQGAIPFVSDISNEEKLANNISILKSLNIDFEVGKHSERIYDCDLFVVSPGIPSDSPIILEALSKNIKAISEIEFASYFCRGKIIGITGTNGKTTTTSLVGHLLTFSGIENFVAGNIGNAFSSIADKVKSHQFAVLEVSSFQLDLIKDFNPYISAILNITPDHLNRYNNDVIKYAKSKQRIYENHSNENYLIINNDSELLIENLNPTKSIVKRFSTKQKIIHGCYLEGTKVIYNNSLEHSEICDIDDILIKGEHNIQNAMCAIIVGKILALENNVIKSAINSFKGVEHRIEFVKEVNGICFYNDSKATNVDSVIVALKSFNSPILLILGGQDKGNDYSLIEKLVREKVKKIYAIGESSNKVFEYFHSFVDTTICKDLNEVIILSLKDAKKGDIVLLSPACASFDMFDNYEHRGKTFKELVNRL